MASAYLGNAALKAPNAAPAPATASAGAGWRSWKPTLPKWLPTSLPASRLATIVLLTGTAVVVLLLVVLIIRLRGKNPTMFSLTKGVVDLHSNSVPLLVNGTKLPPTVEGQEFSYSFWLYLHSVSKNDAPPVVFLRSASLSMDPADPSTMLGSANPVVFLNKATNRLHIAVTTTATPTTPSLDDLANQQDTLVVDYVPLQRWVHYAFCIKDNNVILFEDGDLYMTHTLSDSPVRPMFKASSGSVQVGQAPLPQADAVLSKLQFFSYALTPRQIKGIYRGGPGATSFLSRFGLPPYKFRTPIYRVKTMGSKK